MALKKKRKNILKALFEGDLLLNDFWRRQIGLIVLIVALVIVYISNRYACQHEQLQIQQLREELTDIRYEALARSSELNEKSRQSNIKEYIVGKGSELQPATHPAIVLRK